MRDINQVPPTGWIHQAATAARIDVDPTFKDGLPGMEGFAHIVVSHWFHENDNPEAPARLQVHPRNNPANPVTGDFATHAPVRPNPVALSVCRIIAVDGTTLWIEKIVAHDGAPVIDLKCTIPDRPDPETIRLPDWV